MKRIGRAVFLLAILSSATCDAPGSAGGAEPPARRSRPTSVARSARSFAPAALGGAVVEPERAAGVPARVAPSGAAVEPETLAVVRTGLASADYATRLVATDALGCAPATVAIQALERQLADPEEDVRAAAIAALHRQTPQADRMAQQLLRSVRDDDQEKLSLRVLAAAALINPPPSCR
jgi:HEAT repeat protein